MIISAENYFSPQAQQEYLSCSQYKDFIGTYGIPGCEARAMAKLRGQWHDEVTPSMLVGSYVDAHFDGTMAIFKAKNPAIFRRDGELRSVYLMANDIIAVLEDDDDFMPYMAGRKQVVFTGKIFGVLWKCKIDSYIENVLITDLKVMKSLTESFYVRDLPYRLNFIEYWGYDFQGAIYQELVWVNTGNRLPFFIAAASKEKEPDHGIYWFKQEDLDALMEAIEPNIQRIMELKSGSAEPIRCGSCAYCRATKKISVPVYYRELLTKI